MIVVGAKDRPAVRALLADAKLKETVEGLKAEQYVLKTLKHDGRPVVLIVGGDAIGTLYGAYRLAEHLGVRFYLHGDVIPDGQIALELPVLGRSPQAALRRCAASSRSTTSPKGPTGGTATTTRRFSGSCPSCG